MAGFGQYDQGGGSAVKMPTAIYDFVVVDADVVRDGRGEPVVDQKSKKVRFKAVLEVRSGEFKGERCPRTMNVSFAPSQDGKYGPFPEFINVCTGIPCGDARQKEIGRDELRGRVLQGMVKHERGYNNVTEFIAVESKAPPAPRAEAPRPARTEPPARAAAPGDANDQDLGHRGGAATKIDDLFQQIGEPSRRQIKALADAKRVDETRLALLIAKVQGKPGTALEPTNVGKLIEALKAEVPA